MKKQTVLSLLCACALTAGALTGLTGFADKTETKQKTGDYTLLSTSEVARAGYGPRWTGCGGGNDAGGCLNYK